MRFLPVFMLAALACPTLVFSASADVPIVRVAPSVPASSDALGGDPATRQVAMPSLAVHAAFLAEKDLRGPEGEHIQRADNHYISGSEVYFYVSMQNVSRDPVAGPDGAFAIALRAQMRDASGMPLNDWADIHTYTGTMSMGPDDPEYFDNWVTGGLGPEVEPGSYQLALEFTDTLRTGPAASVPVEVVFDLLYPNQ